MSHPQAPGRSVASSDEQLARAAKESDDQALISLIRRYEPFVRGRAGSISSRAGLDADDLFQEGMIALLGAIRNYSDTGAGSFKTYASVCVNNKLSSALTAHMRGKNTPMRGYFSLSESEDALSQIGLSNKEGSPENLVIESEEKNARNRRINGLLSGFERQVLQLYLNSYSYEEMAKNLGTSTKAVDNALQRVRRKLRSVFTHD